MILVANVGRRANPTYLHDSCEFKLMIISIIQHIFNGFFMFDYLFVTVLQKAFNSFDSQKTGSISTELVSDILRLMGQPFDKKILEELIEEVDEDSKYMHPYVDVIAANFNYCDLFQLIVYFSSESGRLEFVEFVQLAAKFIVEEDAEAMQKELKEAFRLYDKDGNGFIPTTCLKEILRELDDQLTDHELDGMIEEIDSDGSGTVDFDEFMEMMVRIVDENFLDLNIYLIFIWIIFSIISDRRINTESHKHLYHFYFHTISNHHKNSIKTSSGTFVFFI